MWEELLFADPKIWFLSTPIIEVIKQPSDNESVKILLEVRFPPFTHVDTCFMLAF